MPSCEICGSVDFVCDSGYYFCVECQTQLQDVHEQVLDEAEMDTEVPADLPRGNRKRKRSSVHGSSSEEESMTSWECFNFALIGLADQLIKLGAKPEVKLVTLQLWSRYLSKMEVAFYSHDSAALPKLGPNFKQSDANLIYGCALRKRELKKTKENQSKDGEASETSIMNETTRISKNDFMKKRREVIQQNYTQMMKEMSVASQSLADVTLEMLSVSELGESNQPRKLQFNAEAGNLKHLAINSLQGHPGYLVRNRLIAILYIALIICKETIQLSDLFRWISEEHLWYGHLVEFLPKDIKLQAQNKSLFYSYQPCPSYNVILNASGRFAKYIGLKNLPTPSVRGLIKKFVSELNLPAQVIVLAERLLDLLPSGEGLDLSYAALPNWEGQAMAHIIVVLKLLLGLDDATEHQNSRIAQQFNRELESKQREERLFVWDDWERFCVARRSLLSIFHVPSYLKKAPRSSSLQNTVPIFTKWKKDVHASNVVVGTRASVLLDTQKSMIGKLIGNENDDVVHPVTFPPCLTPLSNYIKVIVDSVREGSVGVCQGEWGQLLRSAQVAAISTDFSSTRLDFLTHPEKFIEWANQTGLEIGLHSGSAVSNVMPPSEKQSRSLDPAEKRCRVKVILDRSVEPKRPGVKAGGNSNPLTRFVKYNKPLILPKGKDFGKRKDCNDPIPDMSDTIVDCGRSIDSSNRSVDSINGSVDSSNRSEESTPVRRAGRPKRVRKSIVDLKLGAGDESKMLHLPHTEYWRKPFNLIDNWQKARKHLPHSFLRLLDECASLLNMEEDTLYREVTYLEVLHENLFNINPDSVMFVNHFKARWSL